MVIKCILKLSLGNNILDSQKFVQKRGIVKKNKALLFPCLHQGKGTRLE